MSTYPLLYDYFQTTRPKAIFYRSSRCRLPSTPIPRGNASIYIRTSCRTIRELVFIKNISRLNNSVAQCRIDLSASYANALDFCLSAARDRRDLNDPRRPADRSLVESLPPPPRSPPPSSTYLKLECNYEMLVAHLRVWIIDQASARRASRSPSLRKSRLLSAIPRLAISFTATREFIPAAIVRPGHRP